MMTTKKNLFSSPPPFLSPKYLVILAIQKRIYMREQFTHKQKAATQHSLSLLLKSFMQQLKDELQALFLIDFFTPRPNLHCEYWHCVKLST